MIVQTQNFKSKIQQDYKIEPVSDNINLPSLILPDDSNMIPSQEKRLEEKDFQKFVKDISDKIANRLNLKVSL